MGVDASRWLTLVSGLMLTEVQPERLSVVTEQREMMLVSGGAGRVTVQNVGVKSDGFGGWVPLMGCDVGNTRKEHPITIIGIASGQDHFIPLPRASIGSKSGNFVFVFQLGDRNELNVNSRP